MWQSNNCT